MASASSSGNACSINHPIDLLHSKLPSTGSFLTACKYFHLCSLKKQPPPLHGMLSPSNSPFPLLQSQVCQVYPFPLSLLSVPIHLKVYCNLANILSRPRKLFSKITSDFHVASGHFPSSPDGTQCYRISLLDTASLFPTVSFCTSFSVFFDQTEASSVFSPWFSQSTCDLSLVVFNPTSSCSFHL